MPGDPRAGAAAPDTITFALADPRQRYRAVRLTCGLSLPPDERRLRRAGTRWTLELPRPAVDRLEYEFEVETRGGRSAHICDPANPRRVQGEFGPRSVLLLADYREPAWLAEEPIPGRTTPVVVRSRALRADVTLDVWAPAGVDRAARLPLLVAHDGPAYDRVSRLTHYAGAMIAADRLPPHRIALLAAGERDEWYSASARYARALTQEILPALRQAVGVTGRPVGIGASLGGLALLHAQHRIAGAFGGLFLQSPSFFVPRHDAHEGGFARYGRIVRFVSVVQRAPAPPDAPAIVLTCGLEEENLANNRATAEALAARGWTVALHALRGLHDHVAWRDALDPHLTDLLARMWRVP